MALSQKYSGKVLVPWYNLAEWQKTKEFIYSNSIESQQAALNRLKIWKLRTPMLSSGIEGTLILLEALLEKEKQLTDYELANIYSTALLRFLNICAARNDRQGTFYKTAEKNDLPYWLVTLRHDIAHDHKVPSINILTCAINECFQWIKIKYWDLQGLKMKDHVISNHENFKSLIHLYSRLNLFNYYKKDTKKVIIQIKNKFYKFFTSPGVKLNSISFLSVVEDVLLKFVTSEKIKDISELIISTLIDEGNIFSVECCLENGEKRIPRNFLSIWSKIINDILNEYGMLFSLINKLFEMSNDTNNEESKRELSALWIAELYRGFENISESKGNFCKLGKDDEFSPFSFLEVSIEESKMFQERILRSPNDYTLNYLELVLSRNGNDIEFIKKQCKIIKNLFKPEKRPYVDSEMIYTLEDIKDFLKNKKIKVDDTTLETMVHKQKFRKLTDAEKFCFKGYPLGVLPPKFQ